ncbi:type VI secretion system-associated protein TagF [Pseudomonas turukhanskensis]|uniref:Type VI secretion-associated protein n=1 Tax=Pseudomonas turukhanskensis TaxID=1806536 RepID=A0A9W6NF11_9PSED|nr:type VI secretion system-associated protein TagF [Pseudomonas turukhanskensis]GLK88362.1 type VI secretion-associated protein [Pseudomonas turukhanskensis]
MGAGFYGKLAGRGDFLSRDLPPTFIEAWDAWLAAGMAASQTELGDAWLDAYLVSPLWRFAVPANLLGSQPVVGVMMPSIDRVGRYFPLTIASLLASDADIASVVGGDERWFEQAEALLLSTLEPDADVDRFEQGVQALGTPPANPRAPVGSLGTLLRSGATSAQARTALLAQLACEGASCWWGHGSNQVAAGMLRCQGLPALQDFARLLIGDSLAGVRD